MGGDAVEVVVRFAGTLLAAERVLPGGRYVVGTARDVDLPLDIGVTSFPLVGATANGFMLRLPAGMHATCDGAVIVDQQIALARGVRIVITAGRVTISLTRVADAPIAMPRPTVSKRIVPYALAALVAHVAVVLIAMWTADIDPIAIPVIKAAPARVPTKTLPIPKPKPKPKKPKPAKTAQQAAAAAPAEQPDGGGTPAQQQARAVEAAKQAGFLGTTSLDDLSMLTGKVDIAKALSDVGPVWDEEAAYAKMFGGASGNFNPQNDPAFDSVKTGRYATTSTGRGAGAGYKLPAHGKFKEVDRPPIMGLTCDDGECKTVGSLDRFTVRDYVEKRYVDFLKCYERHAKNTARVEFTLHFDIGRDGRPAEVYAEGGTGFGSCIVRIVEQHVKFPSDKPTQVTYPIAFWRNSAG